jgi:signal transduction histidine kinase
MDSLLSGLLRLSRLGRAALNMKQLDMNKLMSDVVASFEFQVKEMGATLEVEELPPCMGDETQINQVFSNLLDNALKFLDPSRPGVIKISGNEEKNQVVYCVKDNGIGIGEKDKETIFEIFRRLNPVDKPGEGLGLTIVRKILDRHEGRIWVESDLGKGSKFFAALPAKVTRGEECPLVFGEVAA